MHQVADLVAGTDGAALEARLQHPLAAHVARAVLIRADVEHVRHFALRIGGVDGDDRNARGGGALERLHHGGRVGDGDGDALGLRGDGGIDKGDELGDGEPVRPQVLHVDVQLLPGIHRAPHHDGPERVARRAMRHDEVRLLLALFPVLLCRFLTAAASEKGEQQGHKRHAKPVHPHN